MTDKTKASLSMMGNTNRLGFKTTDLTKRNMSTAMKRSHKERKRVEMTKELKLACETIRLLLDIINKSVKVEYHIDKLKAIERAEAVYANLSGKG